MKSLKVNEYMTKHDLVLIIGVLIISIIGIGIMAKSGTNYDQRYVVIKVDGSEVKKISIDKSSDDKIYEFLFNGTKGYIETKGIEVRMLPMDRSICPRGICSATGWIKSGYESIVCLPNRISVEFEEKSSDELDLMSH